MMTTSLARMLVAGATTSVLGLGLATAVQADETATDGPCATQEAQVAKAQAALARVTAVFEAKKDKVAEATAAVAAATTPEELATAQKHLAKAQEKAAKAKDKKAQVQRLAKAEARLAECKAAPSV